MYLSISGIISFNNLLKKNLQNFPDNQFFWKVEENKMIKLAPSLADRVHSILSIPG
jgi:hypothetical protein